MRFSNYAQVNNGAFMNPCSVHRVNFKVTLHKVSLTAANWKIAPRLEKDVSLNSMRVVLSTKRWFDRTGSVWQIVTKQSLRNFVHCFYHIDANTSIYPIIYYEKKIFKKSGLRSKAFNPNLSHEERVITVFPENLY